MTGFADNNNFFFNRERLRATDPSGVKQNFCCPRSQSASQQLNGYKASLFQMFIINLFIRCFQYPRIKPDNLDNASTLLRQYHVTDWTNEKRPSVNSSIGSLIGNRSMHCWPDNKTILQLIGILLKAKMLCIYCITFI